MDSIYQQIGEFGPYQIIIFALTCVCSFLIASPVVVSVFTEAVPKHRCYIPLCDDDNSQFEEDFLNFTIPIDKDEDWVQCTRFKPKYEDNTTCSQENYHLNGDLQVACTKWIYDQEQFTSTAATEFDLVCEKGWLKPFSASVAMVGMLFGAISMGYIADRYGRRVTLLICISIYGIVGLGEVFAPSYALYLLMRFLRQIGGNGMYYIAFVLAIEFVGAKWRTFCGIMISIPFALGEAASGVLAYFVRDFRWLLFYLNLPVFLLVSYYWILPESIRWLLAKGRQDEALKIVQRAAKINGLEIPMALSSDYYVDSEKNDGGKSGGETSILKLISSPIMRKRSLILFYCWIVCILVYYGISLTTGSLSGNTYLNFIAMMLIEIPGYLFAYFALDRIGRKATLCSTFLVCGVACIAAGFIPPSANWLIVTMNLIGKFGITTAFASIILFTSELYPTEYRNIGLGACSTCARIGGVAAPFIANMSGVYLQLPVLIFGGVSFIAGLAILALPETAGAELPQTLQQSESFGLDQPVCCFFLCKKEQKAKGGALENDSSSDSLPRERHQLDQGAPIVKNTHNFSTEI